jgi:serine/threonine protein kinase
MTSKVSIAKSKRQERFALMNQNEVENYIKVDKGSSLLKDIRSLHDLLVDWSRSLGAKTGNINMVHNESHRCRHRMVDHKLVVKKIECLDQAIYNQKIIECDQHSRFSHHPNILTQHTYWNESTDNPFHYKSIYVIYDECLVGDINSCIVTNPLKPSYKSIMKYICDLSKGLTVLHMTNITHGGIRPSNLFINHLNDLVIGPIKLSELESLRQTRHLLSKFIVDRYMKHYFIFWAPEVMLNEAIVKGSDIWALGVLIFVLASGEFPFDLKNEQ